MFFISNAATLLRDKSSISCLIVNTLPQLVVLSKAIFIMLSILLICFIFSVLLLVFLLYIRNIYIIISYSYCVFTYIIDSWTYQSNLLTMFILITLSLLSLLLLVKKHTCYKTDSKSVNYLNTFICVINAIKQNVFIIFSITISIFTLKYSINNWLLSDYSFASHIFFSFEL